MDELRAFFNNPGPSSSHIVKLRGPLTSGMRITKEDSINQLDRRESHRRALVLTDVDYAREIQDEENKVYLKNEIEREKWDSVPGGLESLEQLSSLGSMLELGELTEEAMTEVYSKYSFQMKEDTNKLSINSFKQQILAHIRGYPVVIIEGPTGCGKTTQVPQWILDDSYQHRKPCKIIVTQPRRIAAMSIAKRVAQERGWDVGGLVGYQVGLENRTTNDTRIHYVTTGVLLQKLVSTKNMNEYTHIILDEVHERGQEMDFLLLVVKKLLYTVSPNVKVILMSATFQREVFADYFTIPTPLGQHMVSSVTIEKKNQMFTVETFYLNALTKFGTILERAMPKGNDPIIMPEMYHLVVKLINAFEQIDKKEDGYTDRCEVDLPSVLVFLPGINEIEDLYACLTDLALRERVAGVECPKYKWWVLPLHSTITADEQVRVFQRAPPGHRKIILATNIAESSITVPDIKYVVDFCLMKVLVADEQTNFTSLQMCWASKSNCEQRAGRAGRVRDGRVYRLVRDRFYEKLPDECPPEIARCPLERLVLLAKQLHMGPPRAVLALAMTPPNLANIQRTVLVLKEVGALKKTLDGEWSSTDGDITYLGRIMAKLPLDVKVSKIIMLGHIFGCLEESIIIAASLSVKNVFSSPFRERLNAYNSKLTWADGSTSDCIAFLNVYKVWNHLRKQQFFKQAGNNEAHWARRFYVQIRALRELDDMVREITLRLSREGIEPLKGTSPWSKADLAWVYKVILAGAFYPQYFVQVSQDENREREAVKTLNGLDPRNTVYLRNFPDNQPREVYVSAIKNAVQQQIGDEPRVTFDKNSSKVYLTFTNEQNKRAQSSDKDPTIPGQVVLPVYKAIKARQLKMDIRIPLLPVETATGLAAAMACSRSDVGIDLMVPRLPAIDETYFPLIISQYINVGRFWVQYNEDTAMSELNEIQRVLNGSSLLAYTETVQPGDLLAAPYTDADGTRVYRARVQRTLPRDMVELCYIDYGSFGRVNKCNLRQLPSGSCASTPPLAMLCALAEVGPSPLLDRHVHWTPKAEGVFRGLVNKGHLMGKIYSVVQGVVSIELLAEGGRVSVNNELVRAGLAVRCEETYDSKMNHDIRLSASGLNMSQIRAYNREQMEHAYEELREIKLPNTKNCTTDVCLKGPDSPLEMTVHNLMYAGRDKQVVIEWNSVNSVLLDNEPQKVYERLLVAADVGQNENSSKLTLRHTTLMPNIPGLPAIITLLFCPTAELRRSCCGSRFVSALAGLGCDERGAPLFPEHDLLVDIDADLSIDDIGLINHIRYLMDYMLLCGEGQDSPAEDEFRPRVPATIREDLLKLLLTHRKHREPQSVPNAWEWNSVPEEEILEIADPELLERCVIYPLHAPLDLKPVSRERLMALKRDVDQLAMLVGRTSISSGTELSCPLCGTAPMPPHAMRIHLYSNSHKEKEEDFNIISS